MKSLLDEKGCSAAHVFKRRYGMPVYTENKVIAKGKITIHISWIIVLLRGILRLLNAIPPYEAKDIPVIVTYSASKTSNCISIDRLFYYPHKKPFHFQSQLWIPQDNICIEFTKFHLGTIFFWRIIGNQLTFDFQKYVLKFYKWFIRIPMGIILGKCNAKETALSDTTFSMELKFIHPWFGTTYEYFGTFEIDE